jgi:hypothetical protein
MARVIKPPAALPVGDAIPNVFLAGSIEMGLAEDWQTRFAGWLEDDDVVLLNPRRDEWDASWEQSIHNQQFREQVEWELAAQEQATVIAMYFAPATRAPITLLELGLAARSGKAIVCCPAGFWRKGNVEVVCRRYGIPLAGDLEELASLVRLKLRQKDEG